MPWIIIVKKLVSRILFPLPFFLLVAIDGFIMAFGENMSPFRKKLGKFLIASDLILLYLGCVFGGNLLHILEYKYSPLDVRLLPKEPHYVICVFCSDYVNDENLPMGARFPINMIVRMSEAGRIAHSMEQAGYDYEVVVSMQHESAEFTERNMSVLMFMHSFGIAPENVSILPEAAYNSRMELDQFSNYEGKLIFVSNSWHLPRIMYIAEKMDVSAMPAPVGFTNTRFSPIPSAGGLACLRNYIYEELGILEYKFRDIVGIK